MILYATPEMIPLGIDPPGVQLFLLLFIDKD
jgi:hypothetical protein